MGLFTSEYKFSCRFKSPTMGEGKFSCAITIGFLRSKVDALDEIQEQMKEMCPDAEIILDTVKFEKL